MNASHALFPTATPEQQMAESFVIQQAQLLRARLLPEFIASLPEKDWNQPYEEGELGTLYAGIRKHPAYQTLGIAAEQVQDALWRVETGIVGSQIAELQQLFKEAPKLGQLCLKNDFIVPRDQLAVDIHRMPGGYCAERYPGDDDIFAGALYDRGVYTYSGRMWGPASDLFGVLLIRQLNAKYPALAPRKVLDMGCSVGHSTLPYANSFPHAQLFGVDVSSPLLRYARARAAYQGVSVDFVQADATATEFPDQNFDLIVSHILTHELPVRRTQQLFSECYRLLPPGGIMALIDLRPYCAVGEFPAMTIAQAFASNIDQYHNNEPYWQASRSSDKKEMAHRSGFSTVDETLVSPVDNAPANRMWYALFAQK